MNCRSLRKEISIDKWDDVKRMFRTHGLVSGGLEYHGREPKAPNSETSQFRALGEVDRMTLHSLVASGGKIVVIGGRMNPLWNRFAENPRVVFWTGDRQYAWRDSVQIHQPHNFDAYHRGSSTSKDRHHGSQK